MSVRERPHPSWEEMRQFIDSGDPSLHPLGGKPELKLYVDPDTRRLGLRIPEGKLPDGESPLAEIEVVTRTDPDGEQLDLFTTNKTLFPYFYAFALSLADRIQVDQVDSGSAIRESFIQWRSLLRQAAMLSEEKQLGLMGELWLLSRLYVVQGLPSLQAWTGPRGQAHDFRVGAKEFEVKTTRMESRIHAISSITQLVSSPGHQLYLLSLQVAAAGIEAGFSLDERIDEVRALASAHGEDKAFDSVLETAFGILPETQKYYRDRLILRSRPLLVPITDQFPCIHEEDLQSVPQLDRISDVRYRVDVDGLGFIEGSPEFSDVLPSAREKT